MSTPASAKARAKALAPEQDVASLQAATSVESVTSVESAAVPLAPVYAPPDTTPALEVLMTKGGASTLVRNNASVAAMQALGWTLA